MLPVTFVPLVSQAKPNPYKSVSHPQGTLKEEVLMVAVNGFICVCMCVYILLKKHTKVILWKLGV